MAHEMLKGMARTAMWALLAIIISLVIWGVWGNMQYQDSLKQCPSCQCTVGLGNFLCWQWQTVAQAPTT